MKLTLVPRTVALRFGRLSDTVKTIAGQQQALINALYRYCAENKTLKQAGVIFQEVSDGSALLVTPVGNARTKNGWTVLNSQLLGTLTFERERKDAFDRVFWEPIFALTFPENESAFSTKEAGGIHVGVFGFDDDLANALADVISTIVYRIVMGAEG